MVKLSVDLGVETESRLAAFAAAQGINVSDAVADAVRDAVSQLLAESEKGTPYRPLGEPNAETLAAIAELNDPNRLPEKLSLDEFKNWMREVVTESKNEGKTLEQKNA